MKKTIIFFVVVIGLLVSCDNPFWNNTQDKQPVIQDTVIEYTYDEIAASMDIWYFDELTPTDTVAQKIYNEIALIDSQWHDSLTEWSNWVYSQGSLHPNREIRFIQFRAPWESSRVKFQFESAAFESILDNSHTEFYDTLQTLSYDSLILGSSPYGDLYLEGIQNPLLAARLFSSNSSIRSISLSSISTLCNYSNIYPSFEDQNSKYFYTFEWGDCPSGAFYFCIFYFEIKDGDAILVDIYNNLIDGNVEPSWADLLIASVQKWGYKWWEEF